MRYVLGQECAILKIWQNLRQDMVVPLARKANEVILSGWIKTEGKNGRLENRKKCVMDSF